MPQATAILSDAIRAHLTSIGDRTTENIVRHFFHSHIDKLGSLLQFVQQPLMTPERTAQSSEQGLMVLEINRIILVSK
jgi:hypothetical protein